METKTIHCKHSSIGKGTHQAGTATAHMRYITREDACTEFQSENMPTGRGSMGYFDKLANAAGAHAKARVCDKLIIALPLELNTEQQHDAIATFMQKLGGGRIAYAAAFHDKGEDAHNPHAHIVFHDRDIDTGKKVLGTTTSLRDVREAVAHGWKVPPRIESNDFRHKWADHLNSIMERERIEVRFDARSYKEQGIDKTPQIHVGHRAHALAEKGIDAASRDRERGKATVNYTMLDEGNRIDHNACQPHFETDPCPLISAP